MKHTPHSLKQTFRWLFVGLVVVALWLTPGLQASSNPEPVVTSQEAAPSCPPAMQSDPEELQRVARQREAQRARVLLVGRKQELTAIVNLPDALTADKGQIDTLSEWNQKGNQPLQNGFVRLIPEIVSVEIDRTALKAKTAADESGTMLRKVQSDELVTTLKFQIAGAFQIRPCLSNVRLPKGTTIWTYAETGEPQGPVGIDLVTPDGDLWCPTIEGSTVWIEIHIPKAAFSSSETFSFQLSKALETFRLNRKGVPISLEQQRGVFQPLDDSCLQDVTCVQPTQLINNASRGVGRMQFISGGSGFVCTGGLLNDQDTSGFIPYFLTANHCLSTQSEVSSLEVWWDYKTSTCNGTPPSSNSLQKSFGGTLLATSAGSDFTFIRLQSVPANRIFLGWNAGTLGSGVQLFRVHNPGGDVQHYSEHRTVSPTSTCQSLPPSAFLYSEDLVAATAGGSSGSPVLNSSEQVVGQLFGSCGPNPEDNCDRRNRTVDGRFSTTFSQIRQFLEGSSSGGDCTPTAISGNTFSTTASITNSSCTVNFGTYTLPDTGEALGTNRLSNLYSFSGSSGEKVTIGMGSSALDCALVLTIVQGESNTIVAGDDDSGPGTDSQISFTLNTSGTYRIYATSVGTTQTGSYSITFSKQAAGGDCTPTAISGNSFSTTGSITSSSCVVNFGSYALPDSGETLGTNRLSVLYSLSGASGEKVTIGMDSSALDCALVLTIVQGESNTIVAGDDDSGPGTDAQITFTLTTTGTYRIYATSVGSTQTGSFTFSFSKQPASGGCTPTAISGNSFSTTGTINSSSCAVNFGSYTLPDSGEPLGTNRLSNVYSFSGASGDRVTITMGSATLDCALVLTMVTADSNTIVAGDDDSGPSVDSQITFTLNTAGNYQIYAASVGSTQTGSYSFSFSRQTSGGTCTYSLSPASREFSASGGSGQVSVTVTAGTNCTWTAQSNDSWIVLSNTGGTGSGAVNYTVQTNTSASSRTGTITIANQTHTVTQSGAAGCAFSISPSSRQFAQAGGSGSVSITVTAGTNCNWTAQTNDSWIVLSNTGGTGNGTVNYTVQANSTGNNRTGTIFVAGQTHTVSQTGGDTTPPTVNVVFPRTGDTITASTILTIGWVSTDNIGVTSQGIDLSTNGGSSFGITVATGLSGAVTSFDFSVPSTLTTTSALVRVTARDAAGNQGSGTSGIFTIAQPVDTTPPTVTVTAPTGKKIFRGTSFLTAWVSQDTGSGLASHDIQLSLDAGATFPFTLATGLSGSTQSINLTVPTSVPKSKTSRIRVIARDVAGNVGQGDSIVLKLK
ncbi:MAG: pre-peptidase C-terminal domain-containing protein [Acidobacteria bacterium]|nr:pre-peptidase C-terminal domain-containing protein [Acidobacteriota bacterium]